MRRDRGEQTQGNRHRERDIGEQAREEREDGGGEEGVLGGKILGCWRVVCACVGVCVCRGVWGWVCVCVCVLCVRERERKPGARKETGSAKGNQGHEMKTGARKYEREKARTADAKVRDLRP
jgi:hypothetical protein